MKWSKILMAMMACMCLALAGCVTTNPDGTTSGGTPVVSGGTITEQDLAMMDLGVSGAMAIVMQLAWKDPVDASNKAKIFVKIANGIEVTSQGKIPTVAEMRSIVTEFVPDKKHWTDLATNIASKAYAVVYPKIKDNMEEAQVVIERICDDIREGAQPYILE
jgi:hypothetical protein